MARAAASGDTQVRRYRIVKEQSLDIGTAKVYEYWSIETKKFNWFPWGYVKSSMSISQAEAEAKLALLVRGFERKKVIWQS
jgi:hypothetical protein